MARGDPKEHIGPPTLSTVAHKGNYMSRLEDLARGATVKGILPDSPITVVDVRWIGSNVIELTYKDAAGRPYNELVYRDREPTIEIVTTRLPRQPHRAVAG